MDFRTFALIAIQLIVFGFCSVTATYQVHQHRNTARIVNGTVTSIEENPWQVAIRYKTFLRCGGTIISPTWILAAAHCVKNLTYGFFDVFFGSSKYNVGGTTINVTEIIVHPKANHTVNDIALFKLAKPINFTERTQPIDLPNADAKFADGTECFVSGWGFQDYNVRKVSEILRRVLVPILNWDFCHKQYGAYQIVQTNFCAGYKEGLKDGCIGDSGGPLVTFQNGKPLLIGVVSAGYKCAEPGYPGIYTSVASFRNWIKSISGV